VYVGRMWAGAAADPAAYYAPMEVSGTQSQSTIHETARERPRDGLGDIIGRIRNRYIAVAHKRQHKLLPIGTTEVARARRMQCQRLADGAVLARGEGPRRAHRAVDRLFVAGAGVIAAAIDAGVDCCAIGAGDIGDVLIVPQPGFLEADVEIGTASCKRRAGADEVGAGCKGGGDGQREQGDGEEARAANSSQMSHGAVLSCPGVLS
jgi:hypothetical protein